MQSGSHLEWVVIGFSDADNVQLKSLLRKCVHCGFCNATCPSYKVLGNELDGPRGRIHLISDLVSEDSNSVIIRDHLDSCLTCRNCEVTCPSGVEYNKIIALGRELTSARFGRPVGGRLKRELLVRLFSATGVLLPLFGVLSRLRGLMPRAMAASIPRREPLLPLLDNSHCSRKFAYLQGCVQPALAPNTNRALHNLLARLGIAAVPLELNGCCGALAHHNEKHQRARAQALAVIEATERTLAQGCEMLVTTSSACVLEMLEYPWLMRKEKNLQARAEAFRQRVQDLSNLITPETIAGLGIKANATVAFHPPCTLQHGQGIARAQAVDALLAAAGLKPVPIAERNLCCGSAGTYSIMQPKVAQELRQHKLQQLGAAQPDYLATANIGCQVFLQQGLESGKRMWHWIELLEHLANKTDRRY